MLKEQICTDVHRREFLHRALPTLSCANDAKNQREKSTRKIGKHGLGSETPTPTHGGNRRMDCGPTPGEARCPHDSTRHAADDTVEDRGFVDIVMRFTGAQHEQ